MTAILALENGAWFRGTAAGAAGEARGEVVFNTSMTGYQEVLTDPSYRGQIVVMTQPHIGNYGTTPEVAESERPWVEGFIARQFTARFSGSVGDESLVSYLRRHGVPALQGLDTRAVVRRLRDRGALRGVLTTERSDVDALSAEVAAFPTMEGRALVDEVTCAAPYEVPAVGEERRHLAVYDFGVKANILRSLAERGARLQGTVTVTANGNQKFYVPVSVSVTAGPKRAAPFPATVAPAAALPPTVAYGAPITTAPVAVAAAAPLARPAVATLDYVPGRLKQSTIIASQNLLVSEALLLDS